MSPHGLGALVDMVLDLVFGIGLGVLFMLLQQRKIGKKPGESERFDAWHAKWGPKLHLLAWLCFASAVLLGAAKLPQVINSSKSTGRVEGQTFTSNDGFVELTAPRDWRLLDVKSAFNLHLRSADSQMMTGLFVSQRKDFGPDDFTQEKHFRQQLEEIQARRDNVADLEPRSATALIGKTVLTASFVGEKAGTKNYYKVSTISFPADPDILVTAVQTSTPENWAENKPILEQIISSVRLVEKPVR